MHRKFLFLPPVVGSYRFCSLRQAYNGATMSFASVIRESHECCVHLLQHKLQDSHSSVLVRIRRQELEINRRRRDFRRLLSGPLQHHLRLLNHTSEESLRLLRPLLEVSSRPVKSFGRPRPFTPMRLGVSLRT